jgi:hypothetical protein
MYIIETLNRELILTEDLDCLGLPFHKEIYQGTKSNCQEFLEELGYTGPIWRNCEKEETL